MSCGIWNTVCQHLAANAEAYGMGLIAFLIAAGKCMPRPGSSFSLLTFYTWLFDSVQSVLPLPRSGTPIGTLNGVPIPPIPPETPATTTK